MEFYNPGFAFSERKQYDNPITDQTTNNVSYYLVEAPTAGFFDVPEYVDIDLVTGETVQVQLKLKDLVRVTYAERGVVMVDPNPKRPITDEDNVAATKEAAVKKANAIWKSFLNAKANEWYAIVEETKANGRRPAAATGLFKKVLAELHLEDPADTIDGLTKAKTDQQENKDLQAMISALTERLARMEGASEASKAKAGK